MFAIDDQIDAGVKGHHVIHRAVSVADHGNKYLTADRHAQSFQINQDTVGVGIFRIKAFIDDDQVIDVISHAFESIPRIFRHGDLIVHYIKGILDGIAGEGVFLTQQGRQPFFFNKSKWLVGCISIMAVVFIRLIKGGDAFGDLLGRVDGDPVFAFGACQMGHSLGWNFFIGNPKFTRTVIADNFHWYL